MMEVLRILIALLIALPTVYLCVVCGYLLLITLAAYAFRKHTARHGAGYRIAVVIPAHNEAGQIGQILADLGKLDFPRENFAAFVIADNCSDDTAGIVRAAGYQAAERHDPALRGKGHALDWFLKSHQEALASFDAISIVDADMQIDPAYLRELAASLAAPGTRVVQASNAVARPETNWRTALGYLGFSVINHVRPAGRETLGGTAELRGRGMAFERALLLKYGWPAHSLAEDVEFSKQLLLDGIPVRYNPDARVTSELAVRRDQAQVQQQRWEGGKVDIVRRYFPRLLRKALETRQWLYIDAVLDILVPPLSVLVLLLVGTGILAAFVHTLWVGILAVCACALVISVLSGPLLTHAPLKVWVYLLAAPVFVAWKAPMYARLLLAKTPAAWQRTPRNHE
jgi:cellulose synthase/poly-beta-1,6-N-acetylglucosamine synthase-like glycosyltransferase